MGHADTNSPRKKRKLSPRAQSIYDRVSQPTRIAPGSKKVPWLMARYRLGLPLWHPQDRAYRVNTLTGIEK